jgi:hypothetical protein
MSYEDLEKTQADELRKMELKRKAKEYVGGSARILNERQTPESAMAKAARTSEEQD